MAKTIEELIFDTYSESEHYDHLKFGIKKIHKHMMENSAFQKMSIAHQFDMCVTAFLVAQHTLLDHMNNNRPISPKDNIKREYSIYFKNKPKKTIELNSSPALLLNS